jgi:lipoprotein NlpI
MAEKVNPQSIPWKKHETSIKESIAVLERAQAELLAGDLSDDLRADAAREAQVLVDSLGTLNMQRGREFAQELARLLDGDQVLGIRETARTIRLVDLVKVLVAALEESSTAVA